MRCKYFLVASTSMLVFLTSWPVKAQISIQPTPAPTVAADNEPWFLSRDPIVFAGTVYYPAGAQVHFNRNEMTLSGYYGGIPLYTRVTLEPFSIVYVPVSGGLLQPYERRRTGEIAGTVGTTTPSFPVVSPSAAAAAGELPVVPQSPGPASTWSQLPPPAFHPPPPSLPAPVGTTGVVMPSPRPGQSFSAAKPVGLNGIYLEYGGRRWFSDGAAVRLDSEEFVRVGTYDGFPVYRKRGDANTIFVPVATDAESLVAPYSARQERSR